MPTRINTNLLNLPISFSYDPPFLVSEDNLAIFAYSVLNPVPTTTPLASPETIFVPEKQIFVASNTSGFASLIGSLVLMVATLSPVSADSSATRLKASINRKSAGTMSPGSSNTISPGTKFSVSMTISSPDLTTLDLLAKCLFSSFTVCSDRYS